MKRPLACVGLPSTIKGMRAEQVCVGKITALESACVGAETASGDHYMIVCMHVGWASREAGRSCRGQKVVS